MEPTSQQELKQLLEEGKITEQEYKELLETIRQKETVQKLVENPKCLKSHTSYGKAGLILMIVGIVLPIFGLMITLGLNWLGVRILFFPLFMLLGLLCGLLAFIFGIVGWKTPQGKIAAIGVPCLGLLVVPGLLILLLFSHRASQSPVQKSYRLPTSAAELHQTYPLDTLEGLLSVDAGVIDEDCYVNGSGSLRIKNDSSEKRTIRLYETGPMSIENRMLFYSAQLKSQLQEGKAYLEMWCDFPGTGEFFSRGLDQPITGATEWTHAQIPFRLEAGQTPADVKLNLVIEGIGTVWIDDIKLLSNPLN